MQNKVNNNNKSKKICKYYSICEFSKTNCGHKFDLFEFVYYYCVLNSTVKVQNKNNIESD